MAEGNATREGGVPDPDLRGSGCLAPIARQGLDGVRGRDPTAADHLTFA